MAKYTIWLPDEMHVLNGLEIIHSQQHTWTIRSAKARKGMMFSQIKVTKTI